jgi:hypothetical protein
MVPLRYRQTWKDTQFTVIVAPVVTAPVESGFYREALRVTIGPAMRSTMWTGEVAVDADQFE